MRFCTVFVPFMQSDWECESTQIIYMSCVSKKTHLLRSLSLSYQNKNLYQNKGPSFCDNEKNLQRCLWGTRLIYSLFLSSFFPSIFLSSLSCLFSSFLSSLTVLFVTYLSPDTGFHRFKVVFDKKKIMPPCQAPVSSMVDSIVTFIGDRE